MDSFFGDLRYGCRMLLKTPGVTATAALALILAIGANSAIFSVVDGVLLRPLRYPHADRLAVIWENHLSKGKLFEFVTAPDYRDWKEQQRAFDQIGAFRTQPSILTGRGLPERIETAVVSPEIFSMLGARVKLGRTFLPDEDQPAKNRVAVLSYGLWQRRFGGDAGVLNRTLTLDGKDYTVVGVAAPAFQLPDSRSELWIPYTLDAKELSELGATGVAAGRSMLHTLEVLGRLKPGVTFDQAREEMKGIARGLERQYPDMNAGWSVNVKPLREELIGDIRPTLFVLSAAVAFVLLIACTNVANLLLARAGSREKEIAVRTALGAGRGRILRQLLMESLILALGSGVVGLGLAYAGVWALTALNTGRVPRIDEVDMNWQVLLFTLGVSIATGLLFGFGPALAATKTQLNEALKSGGRSAMASVRSRRLRAALVISEVALSIVLLIGAGLMIHSFVELQNVDPGFRPAHVLTMRVSLPESRYDGIKVAQFYTRLLERVRGLAGVESAAIARDVPLSGSGSADPSLNFIIEHRPALASADQPRAKFRAVSAGYFATMGISLRRGRAFSASDTERAPAVAIINDTLARQYFPNEDPLGKRIQHGFDGSPWYTIVGIIGNVKHAGLDAPTFAEMYYPYQQVPPALMSFVENTMTIVVRARTDPAAMARAVSRELQAMDPEEAVFRVITMQQLIDGSVNQPRFRMFLLGVFAAVALALAGTGLYGVVSYSVSQRSNEMGIRAALGAQKSDLLKLVLGEGTRLALIGIAIGLAFSFVLVRSLQKMLYGVTAHDPATFIAIPALLLAIAVAASYIPARRATRTDPNVVLRYE